MYKVTLQDLSSYPENVVFASDAPAYATIEVDTFEEAFDVVLDYSEVFQCSITYPEGK